MGAGADPAKEPTIDFGAAAGAQPVAFPGPLTVQERIQIATHTLRTTMAFVIGGLFIGVNGAVLFGLWKALQFDFKMMDTFCVGYERIVNTTVIATLLGATTTQLGAIMYVVAKFLFPSPSSR